MTAATMQQTPAIPPRPSRSQDQDDAAGVPKIPPRPTKRFERSVSPNPARFAPSPLSEGIPLKSPKTLRFNGTDETADPIDRSSSVAMPNVGEEGLEYSAVATELREEENKTQPARGTSPEQTSTVAEDLKLHAPKPSLPAHSAKQRVQTVTRTDSDKAAQYGIGRPSESDRAVSRDGIKKKRSTSTFSNADSQTDLEEEHGIPEIGQRVPMNPLLGDVQAPSPAPGSEAPKKHHHRKTSSRGGPPGSYGLHGHGVAPQDKFEKAYYEKHPEALERELKTPLHDRQNDYAMSSNDLNKLVRDTVNRESPRTGIPTDEVAFQASEEYSRISSPQPPSAGGDKLRALSFKSEVTGPDGERLVHVDDPEHPEYRSYGDREDVVDDEDQEYKAPILAADEVQKGKSPYLQQPAVHPPPERRGSSNEMEEPTSRPSSRPTSIYKENNTSQEFGSTPLDDVKEYEPLFDEDGNKIVPHKRPTEPIDPNKPRQYRYFPSKDMWEDAPNSVQYTAEVSTPDISEQPPTKSLDPKDRPKTPAEAFAQIQEELAEKEKFSGPSGMYQPRSEAKQIWTEQPKSSESFLDEKRPAASQRFPSRDVWEDVPESHVYEAEVSSSPAEDKKPEIPSRPAKKAPEASQRPAVPERPKPKQVPSDEGQKPRPPVSDKPKPQIPARPTKSSSGDSKDGEFSKPKPPVPSRPVGGKIAALQAGFMSDLNKRLQLGPQAPKKEESKPEENLAEEKEKAPLADARKSRARGPQRRAPAKSPSAAPAAAVVATSAPVLSFSISQTLWSINPEDGNLAVSQEEEGPVPEKKVEFVEDKEELAPEPVEVQKPAVIDEPEADEAKPEATEDVPSENKPEEVSQDKPEQPKDVDEVPVEEKTLAANTAGESILEATVEKKDGGNEVEPVEVSDEVKA